MSSDIYQQMKKDPVLWLKWCYDQDLDRDILIMNYKLWLRSLKRNPFHPRSERVMRRRLGRYIRRFEKKHGQRSEFRRLETARKFWGGKF